MITFISLHYNESVYDDIPIGVFCSYYNIDVLSSLYKRINFRMSGLQGLQGYGTSESESENEDSPKQQSDQEMGSGPGEDDQGQSPMDLDGVESDEETNPDAASEYSSQLRRLSTTGQMPQITIPPEPQGKIDPRVTAKVQAMYQKHKFGGINYNEMIKSKKSYRKSIFNFYSFKGDF